MKTFALSALVIAASGAYVWSQAGTATDPLLAGLETGSISPQTLASASGDTTMVPHDARFVTSQSATPAAPSFAAEAQTASSSDSGALPPLPAPADSSGFAPTSTDSSGFAPPAPATPAPAAPVAVAAAEPPAAPADPAPASARPIPPPSPFPCRACVRPTMRSRQARRRKPPRRRLLPRRPLRPRR